MVSPRHCDYNESKSEIFDASAIALSFFCIYFKMLILLYFCHFTFLLWIGQQCHHEHGGCFTLLEPLRGFMRWWCRVQSFLYVDWTLHFLYLSQVPFLPVTDIKFLCPSEISLSRLKPFLKVTQLSGVHHVGLRTGLFLPLHCWGSYVTLGHLKVYHGEVY